MLHVLHMTNLIIKLWGRDSGTDQARREGVGVGVGVANAQGAGPQ